MSWRILVINPGSTSTKVAVFDDEMSYSRLIFRIQLSKFSNFRE